MNTFVVYDSQFGNTERIANIIANTLIEFGQVRAVRVNQIHAVEVQGVDLLVVGCPTQGWRPTPAMQSLLEHLPAGSLNRLAVPCFDTRLQPWLRVPAPDRSSYLVHARPGEEAWWHEGHAR